MKWFTYIAVVAILGLWVFLNYQDGNWRPAGQTRSYAAQVISTPTPAVTTHQVVYKVETGNVWSAYDLCQEIGSTYAMPNGTAQSTTPICGKATSAVVATRTANNGDSLYLSVQNDENNVAISCQIFVDGVLTYETKSRGQYVIASCSGRVP